MMQTQGVIQYEVWSQQPRPTPIELCDPAEVLCGLLCMSYFIFFFEKRKLYSYAKKSTIETPVHEQINSQKIFDDLAAEEETHTY